MRTARQTHKARAKTQELRAARRKTEPSRELLDTDLMRGSICWGDDRDVLWLQMIGVRLGPELPCGFHKCEMGMGVFDKLNPKWGVYFWALDRVAVEVGGGK